MASATNITWHAGDGDSVSVSHVNHIIRYFNGRRYHTVQNRVSFHIPATRNVRELNWTAVHQYVAVAGKRMSYRQSPLRFSPAPVNEIRALLAMVPDDLQAVPF